MKKNAEKTILVISDLHLGAGEFIQGRNNSLEDFKSDQELVEFLNYFSEGTYHSKEVELIINGDFFDFLGVPFVEYFDDEYFGQEASIDRMKIILNAHPQVIAKMNDFLSKPNKTIKLMLGNHDAELLFPKVQQAFLEQLGSEQKNRIQILFDHDDYYPHPEICVRHGHEYEGAHSYDKSQSIVNVVKKDGQTQSFFRPPWGSFYVLSVVNKYKWERPYVNAIRPIRYFLCYGLIFDTFFTIRFMLSNIYYFFMVTIRLAFLKQGSLKKIFAYILSELELFQDYEIYTQEFFEDHPDVKVLLLGHTHVPMYRQYADKNIFINTGSWTKMINKDFYINQSGLKLCFAQIQLKAGEVSFEIDKVELNQWHGKRSLPFQTFV